MIIQVTSVDRVIKANITDTKNKTVKLLLLKVLNKVQVLYSNCLNVNITLYAFSGIHDNLLYTITYVYPCAIITFLRAVNIILHSKKRAIIILYSNGYNIRKHPIL